MKSLVFVLLLLSVGTTAYYFIKEQFNGIALSQAENAILSVSYIITGLSVAILIWLSKKEKKNE